MRRLWPVLGVCVLAGACGRPNPGFALLDSGDPAGSDGQSGSGGSTGTSSVSSAPTSTEASTATTGVVTGSEGTTDPVDPTSTTASGSTDATGGTTMVAGHWEFPTDCGAAYLESEFTDAATDTFFLNEVPDTECSFLKGSPNCQDLEFSVTEKFQLFLQADVNSNKLEDYVGIYAVRFATPTPLHDGQIPIPEAAFLGVEARIHLFRPFPKNPWAPLKFYVRRFTDGDEWMTKEGFDFTPCHAPATSYRCRVCTVEAMVHKPCMVEWGGQEAKHKGVPYDPAVPPIQMLNVQVEPNLENGYPLLLDVFTKEDLAWLTTEGLMLMPGADTPLKSIEVKTLEWAMPEWHPGLRVRYCEPYFVAD